MDTDINFVTSALKANGMMGDIHSFTIITINL